MTEKQFWLVWFGLVCLVGLLLWTGVLRAQTVEMAADVAEVAKEQPLVIGSVHFTKPAIRDGKQIVSDANFASLKAVARKADARVDTDAKVTETYKVMSVSDAAKPVDKGVIEKIIEFFIGE